MSFITKIFVSLLFCLNSYAANNDVVAVVNGKPITKEQFELSYKENQLIVTSKELTKKRVLDDLINRELGIQRAQKSNIATDPVVKRKVDDVIYHAQISKDLEPKLKEIKVSDDDVKNYYKNFPEIRSAHILVRVRAEFTKEEDTAALDHALKMYKAVMKQPDTFEAMANKYSQSGAAPNGGDIGFQPAKMLAPEYFEAIKGKNPGFVSPPVRTQFGYHIIKVIAVKKFEEINEGYYKKLVYDEKRDKIIESYFADLRQDAKIKIETSNL